MKPLPPPGYVEVPVDVMRFELAEDGSTNMKPVCRECPYFTGPINERFRCSLKHCPIDGVYVTELTYITLKLEGKLG